MKPIVLHAAAAVVLSLAIAACVSKPAPLPPPTPAPSWTPASTRPAPPPAPAFNGEWIDAPQTPGDWSYLRDGGQTLASFGPAGGEALLLLRCRLQSREFGLARPDRSGEPRAATIRTEVMERNLVLAPVRAALPLIAADLDPQDPLLDAMALSRGRFAVETEGEPTLYLPSWPEVTRVIEDCR